MNTDCLYVSVYENSWDTQIVYMLWYTKIPGIYFFDSEKSGMRSIKCNVNMEINLFLSRPP